MLHRRHVVVGGPVLVASVIIGGERANALKIGGIFKKVASVAVQGYNWVTNTPLQVATVAKNLVPLVKQISPEVARGTEMVQKIAEQNSTLEARLKWLGLYAQSQGVPVFANTGYQSEQVPVYTDQSARPLQLTSSAQDELRADPYGYVERNSAFLGDHVNTFPYSRTAQSFNLPAGYVGAEGVGKASAPGGAGLYPSVMQLGDLDRLISVFRI